MNLSEFKNLTPTNGAIQSLKELLAITAFMEEELERFFTFRGNVENGKKLGWIGDMEDVGWAGGGCNPTYKKAKISAAEKEWKLGKWELPLEWCYEDLEETIAAYCLKKGTDIADLTSTEYMDEIVYPALETAMKRMMWRFIWFGNTVANNVGSSGVLTDGVDAKLFQTCDGFFKQLFSVCTANASQHLSIAANNEATYALQKSKLKEAKVAIGIFESLLEDADPRIASMDGSGLFVTKSLGDALSKDLKREYKEILTWEQIFKGLEVSEFEGVPIYKVSIWDRFIQRYENDGTKFNLPHRAVFGSPKQLFVGSRNNKPISDLEVWFNQDERVNRIYSCGDLGCLIGEDDLFQLAY